MKPGVLGMSQGIRKALGLLLFLAVLAFLQNAHSKTLNRYSAYSVLGFCLGASGVVLWKTLTRNPDTPYCRIGWGNPMSILPGSWQRWLLDKKRGHADD
jgi:hypothetical protein